MKSRLWKIISIVLLFLTLLIIIFVSALYRLHHASVEVTDFAANSILIQKAKSFDLLTGNYSRVGFNHPGPAILLVLAGGEYVFFDLLHAVPYPIQGQIIAAGMVSGCWLTLIAVLARALTGTWSGAAVLCLPLAFILALVAPGAFDSLWFPNLYVLPFSALLLACANIIRRGLAWISVAALCALFLMHGHVSFVAMTSLIVGASIVIAVAKLWAGSGDRARGFANIRDAIARRSTLAGIVAAGALTVLFAYPVTLRAIRTGGRPFTDYIRYAGAHQTNSWASSAIYLSQFWRTPWLLVLGLAIAVAMVLLARHTATWSIAIVVLMATVVTYLYVLRGVDDLSYDYICEFYFTVPALLVGGLALQAAMRIPRRAAIIAAGAATLASGALIAWSVSTFLDEVSHLSSASVEPTYNALRSLSSGGKPLELDLDYRGDPGAVVWPEMAGVAAMARRRAPHDTFCIGRGWHILFDESYQCDAATTTRADPIRIAASASSACAGDDVLFRSALIEACRVKSVCLKPGERFSNKDLDDSDLLRSGWADAGESHTWSLGHTATIRVCTAPGVGAIAIDLGAFISAQRPRNRIGAYVDGRPLPALDFSLQASNLEEVVPVDSQGGAHVITYQIDDDRSPQVLGYNTDPREIGIYVSGVSAR